MVPGSSAESERVTPETCDHAGKQCRVGGSIPVQERRRVVAAVGIRHGKQVEAIRLFLEAGYLVAAFDPVALHFDPLDDEKRVPFDELTASWPTRFAFIEHPFGESPYLFVSSEELAPGLLAAADARFGKTEVVYLGPGWGGNITSGGDFIAGLAERGGGEFIATEADPPADQVLRCVAEWSAQPWASTVECVTLREPSTGGPSSGRPPADAGESSWRVLTAAGWDGPLSVADADRIARARCGRLRSSGRTTLALRRDRRCGFRSVRGGGCGRDGRGSWRRRRSPRRARPQWQGRHRDPPAIPGLLDPRRRLAVRRRGHAGRGPGRGGPCVHRRRGLRLPRSLRGDRRDRGAQRQDGGERSDVPGHRRGNRSRRAAGTMDRRADRPWRAGGYPASPHFSGHRIEPRGPRA